MTTICIDTETFYSDECTVKTLGNHNYVRHPDWDCYLVSVAGDNGLQYVGPPEEAPWHLIFNKEHRLLSHNTGFDEAVIERLHELGVIPKPEYAVWDDTADLVCFLGVPRSLKASAKILLGAEMSKDVRDNMKGKRFSELPEDKKKDVIEYALKDAVVTLELWTKFSDKWPEDERWLSRHTRIMGNLGLPIDQERLNTGIEGLEKLLDKALAAIPWYETTGKVLSRPNLDAECARVGIEVPKSLAKDNQECIEWEDKYGDTYPFIGAVRNYRRCNMLCEKLIAIRTRIKEDGCSLLSLKYFGGHTGRWSGDGGVNYQNLPRNELFGVDLRRMISAPKGKTFVIVDSSQIEARITLWYAKDNATLDLIRGGMDLYEAHARATMGYEDPMELKEYDKLHKTPHRQMAKVRVLGLGFGCGDEKFVSVARIMSQGKVILTREESKDVVSAYRRDNRKVVSLWRKLEGHLARHANTGQDAVYELPSGRSMTYKEVKRAGGRLSAVSAQRGGLYRKAIWGGVITENLVQATGRDILAHYIRVLAENEGFDVRLHAHDEVVIMCDEDKAQFVLDRALAVMSTSPPWISDLPVAAEGFISNRYTK